MKHCVFCIAAAAFIAACGCSGNKEESASVQRKFTAENGASALERAGRFVKISPRDSGTAGAAYAAQWIARELRGIGLKPVADTWTENTSAGSVQFSNIYADIPGTGDSIVVIGSHFDTKSGIGPGFQGANDGGSSTAVVLELAKVLSSGPQLTNTIRFAFFDGEECAQSYRPNDGLHGSRRMAEQLAAVYSREKAAVIVLDMIGDKDLKIIIPRNVTPWLATVAMNASDNSGYRKIRIAKESILDDHWPFVENGLQAIDLIDFEYGSQPGRHDYWHTEHDTIDKLSAQSLMYSGAIALDMVLQLEAHMPALPKAPAE